MSPTPKTKEPLKSLLLLLATEQGANLKIVREKLVQLGPDVLGQLRHHYSAACSAADEQEKASTAERLGDVIEEINGRELEQGWRQWLQRPDLEEGSFLLSRFAHPDIETEGYQGLLDAMAEELRAIVRHERWPDGVIRVINNYLFTDKGFHGNTVHYYDPDNSFLNRVLDRRVGIPITLSTVYLLLARRLDLPIVGIGMPSHFLVKCDVPGRDLYLDPFNAGQSLSKAECASFLINSGYGFKEQYLQPVTDQEILIRMMRNLIYIYGERQEPGKVRWLSRFVDIVHPNRPLSMDGPADSDDAGV